MMRAVCVPGQVVPLADGSQCALGTEALSCFRVSPVEWGRQVLRLSGLHASAALG